MADGDVIYDRDRPDRIGMPEAILCEGKSTKQIAAAITQALDGADNVLLTRLASETAAELPIEDYDEESQTGIAGLWTPPTGEPQIAVVAAGTSDLGSLERRGVPWRITGSPRRSTQMSESQVCGGYSRSAKNCRSTGRSLPSPAWMVRCSRSSVAWCPGLLLRCRPLLDTGCPEMAKPHCTLRLRLVRKGSWP